MESSGPLSERYADNPVHRHLSVQGLLGNAALLCRFGEKKPALWVDDWRGTRDDYDRNSEHIRRKSCVRESQLVELYGRLHLDLLMQERFLVNGVDIKLKLSRSKPGFVLMGDSADYQIKLEQVHLYVRKVTLNPAVLLAHAKALDKTPV